MAVDQQTYVVIGLIAAGALVMLFAAFRTRGLLGVVSQDTYRSRWRGLLGLMVLFFAGYVGSVGVLLQGYEEALQLLTGGVFLGGALFVLLVVDTGRETIEEAEDLRAETAELNDHLEQKADDYRDVMRDCRDGDFTRRMDPESESEAMTDIAEEFNAMISRIEATVDDLERFADEVATYSQEITMSANEVKSESEHVAESMEEISAKADRQNENLSEASEEMNALLTTIGEIASSSDEVAEIAELTVETGREGRDAAQNAIEGMREVERDAAETVEQMEELEEQVQQIDDLTDFISDIAEQTNMLALNANIEANRDGEGGGGFAVVANEVKQLAAGTKQAAADIEERLESIQTETSQTVEEVRFTSDRIAAHTESVENAVEALDEIAGYAQETNQGIQAIDRATDRQADSTEEVVDIVERAVDISEDTSSESASITEAANAQTVALRQVTDGTEQLATQAQQLSEALEKFTVDVDPDASANAIVEPSTGAALGGDGSNGVDGGDAEAVVDGAPETDDERAGRVER